ncbi:hypothetical protein F6X51_02595 [Methylobacterium planeticum]|uniref:Uncharacterized protein n=1 Tax=Methylobacterium planeticum TaxID=2615211 RepID=A0A6N6MXF8_9HYPH|nr:hypothetical protein F6X51_02595 [Methylobacterium planeticum]
MPRQIGHPGAPVSVGFRPPRRNAAARTALRPPLPSGRGRIRDSGTGEGCDLSGERAPRTPTLSRTGEGARRATRASTRGWLPSDSGRGDAASAGPERGPVTPPPPARPRSGRRRASRRGRPPRRRGTGWR